MLLHNSDFINYMMETNFKLHYWSNKLLQYSVNIIGDSAERKDTTVSEIPDSMFCSYSANFKLMAIKHAEVTSNCDGHGSSVLHNTIYNADENRTTNEWNKFNPKSILWVQAGEFQWHE